MDLYKPPTCAADIPTFEMIWEDFSSTVLKKVPPDEMPKFRNMFFTAGLCLWAVISSLDNLSDEEGVAAMQRFEAEFYNFRQTLNASALN